MDERLQRGHVRNMLTEWNGTSDFACKRIFMVPRGGGVTCRERWHKEGVGTERLHLKDLVRLLYYFA